MEHCDTLLIVGSSFPYIEFMPKPGQARAVQIDTDASRIGIRYPVNIGVVADAKASLQALIPLLKTHAKKPFLEQAQKGMLKWKELMNKQADREEMPLKPQVVARSLSKYLNNTAIITSDSGTIATWWARHIEVKRGQKYSLSGNLASMANGLPYAIGAQVAFPDRQVVAFVGDGGFSMLMAEMATCVLHKLPLKVVIIKNNALGMIKWEQIVFMGNPEYQCDLAPIDFVKLAEAFGVKGLKLDRPQDADGVFQEAFAHQGPVIIEATVDPFEPPMPAKINLKQAAHFAEALARGEPHGAEIAETVTKDKLRELL
jgi:pyruvate dehydrogenase (quinone)